MGQPHSRIVVLLAAAMFAGTSLAACVPPGDGGGGPSSTTTTTTTTPPPVVPWPGAVCGALPSMILDAVPASFGGRTISENGRFMVLTALSAINGDGGAPGRFLADRTLGLVCRLPFPFAGSGTISPNGRFVADLAAGGGIEVFDLTTGTASPVSPGASPSGGSVSSGLVGVSDDGRFVAWAERDTFVTTSHRTDRTMSTVAAEPGLALRLSRDGSTLLLRIDASSSPQGRVKVWKPGVSTDIITEPNIDVQAAADIDVSGIFYLGTDFKVRRHDIATATTTVVYDPASTGVALTQILQAGAGDTFLGATSVITPGPCVARRISGGALGASIGPWACWDPAANTGELPVAAPDDLSVILLSAAGGSASLRFIP